MASLVVSSIIGAVILAGVVGLMIAALRSQRRLDPETIAVAHGEDVVVPAQFEPALSESGRRSR